MTKLKAIAITNESFEDITDLDIKELVPKTKTKIEPTVVIFDGEKEDIMRVAYKSQAVKKVFVLISSFKFKNIDDISKNTKLDYNQYIDESESFAVNCTKCNTVNIPSPEIERSIGMNVDSRKANLKKPDVILGTYLCGDTCYVGLDITGLDLSKRYYKIFAHPSSIKGTLAYFMLRRAGYTGKELFLDPMCGSGTIAIEAAYYKSKMPICYYLKNDIKFTKMKFFDGLSDNFFKSEDKKIIDPKTIRDEVFAYDNQLSCVTAIKKNSKIASVNKVISQGRAEIDWIDTKFEDDSVDLIVTNPPQWNKFNEKTNSKLYDQFFNRIKSVLSKKGKLLILSNRENALDFAKEHKFKLVKNWKFPIGDKFNYLMCFKK